MAQELTNFDLQEKIYQLIQDNPGWREPLTEMVEYENEHGHESGYLGFTWKHVHSSPSMVNRMIAAGILDLSYESRRYSQYRLRSHEDTESALMLDENPAMAEEEQVEVDELFNLVVGHDQVKQMLRYSIKADKPVHVLLHGTVATAKSILLEDIGRLPGAEMYLGSTTTKSGLVGMLLSRRPRYLVIDEIDKMAAEDRQPLLSLMASGRVYRLQHGSNDQVSLPTRVFAAANDLTRVDNPVLSRFVKISIPSYTREQFIEVVIRVLMMKEGLGEQSALTVAKLVSEHSLDVRDAVHVARMSRGFPKRVVDIIQTLWPEKPRATLFNQRRA